MKRNSAKCHLHHPHLPHLLHPIPFRCILLSRPPRFWRASVADLSPSWISPFMSMKYEPISCHYLLNSEARGMVSKVSRSLDQAGVAV